MRWFETRARIVLTAGHALGVPAALESESFPRPGPVLDPAAAWGDRVVDLRLVDDVRQSAFPEAPGLAPVTPELGVRRR